MSKKIAVLGASGNLGGKIVEALLTKNASVLAVVRPSTDKQKIDRLKNLGAEIAIMQSKDIVEISNFFVGVDCVVSALSGLRETIIEDQQVFLDAAVLAKVPRFIPSDFSIDFRKLIPGNNRNLDLRRSFHYYLDKQPIKATTIFNGAFMDLLVKEMPLILKKQKRILCWGNKDQPLEFTHTLDVANYTASVALDSESPRILKITGDALSCNQFKELMSDITKTPYKIFRPGGIGLFNIMIKLTKFFSPSPTELYPPWQGMQYLRDMMDGKVETNTNDNKKYDAVDFKNIKTFLISEGYGNVSDQNA